MKQKLIILALFVMPSAFAQKNSWYIGGTTGFSNGNTKTDSVTQKRMSWAFSPEIGTFLTNNVQLGLGIVVNGGKTEQINNNIQGVFQGGGTLYGRYFFGENQFRPFVGLNVTTLIGKNTTEFINSPLPTSTTDLFTFNTNLNIGFAYGLSPRVGVVGSLGTLGFISEKSTPENGTATVRNDFGLDINSLGNRFTIGVYYTFKTGS